MCVYRKRERLFVYVCLFVCLLLHLHTVCDWIQHVRIYYVGESLFVECTYRDCERLYVCVYTESVSVCMYVCICMHAYVYTHSISVCTCIFCVYVVIHTHSIIYNNIHTVCY